MVAFTLSILALAAGVSILIKVKRDYLGSLYTFLAWSIISLSLVSLGYTGYKALFSCNKSQHCTKQYECSKSTSCNNYNQPSCSQGEKKCCSENTNSGCKPGSYCCIVDREMCSKAMGAAACDSLYKERGSCALTMEECKALKLPCSSDSKNNGNGKSCSADPSTCPKKDSKECCKKTNTN